MRFLFLSFLLLPWLITAQETSSGTAFSGPGPVFSVELLADSLAVTNQIHGPYVGFSGERTDQYHRFEQLCERADCAELLTLSNHENAVVRGYAFWGLARKQYPKLDSLLLAHAQDESLVTEIQGGIMNRIPVIDFMLWVVNPDMMDDQSLKMDAETFRQVTELRFAEDE